MFERFTEKSIKTIMLAQEESRRCGHNFVGTEQILLGLVGEGTGTAAKILKKHGVNLRDTRVEVEKIIGRGSGFVSVEIPFTPRAKRALELAWDEARQLGHNYMGTEHLLLGIIREGEGVAMRVLELLGVNAKQIRTDLLQIFAEAEKKRESTLKEKSIEKRLEAVEAVLKTIAAKMITTVETDVAVYEAMQKFLSTD